MNSFSAWLDGKKTYIAAIGGALMALGNFLSEATTHAVGAGDFITLAKGLIVSLGVFGFGHKLQKLVDALTEKK